MQVKTIELSTRALEDGLATAAAKVRVSEVRAAVLRGIEWGGWIVGGAEVAAAVALVVGRTMGAATPAAAWMVAAGVVAAGVVVAVPWWRARQLRPSLPVVAERLDLAAADHNLIATALDLARSGDRSPIAVRAIAAGVDLLWTAGNTDPVLPERRLPDVRGYALLCGGGVALALAFLIPIRSTMRVVAVSPNDTKVIALPAASPAANDLRTVPPPSHRAPANAPESGSPAPSNALASPTPAQQQSQAGASPSLESTGNSNGSPSQIANAATGLQKPKRSGHGPSPSESGQPPDPARTPDDMPNRPMQLASFGAAAADTALSHSSPRGAAGGNSDDADPSPSKPHTGSGSGGQAAPKSAKSAKQAGSGDGDGPGQRSKMISENKGRSMASGEEGGARGQSGGQDAPKKSRGVAPLILGTPDPDLFEGKQLPGPDERTRLRVTPKPAPVDPAPAAPAAVRAGDEPPVPVYRVPAESRRAVDDYFERFHQDAAAAAAN